MLLCRVQECACLQHRLLHHIDKMLFYKRVVNPSEDANALGKRLLHHLVERNNTTMLKYLIKRGYKINVQDDSGLTPLMTAIITENARAVKILLKNKADIYVSDDMRVNALNLALKHRMDARDDVSESTRQLILNMLFDKLNENFFMDKSKVTRIILDADLELKMAVVSLANVELATSVLDHSFPIDFCEPVGNWTALHYSIFLSKFENAKLLIKRKANINAVNKYGDVILLYYINGFEYVDKNFEVLKSLLKYSTRLSIPGEFGMTQLEQLLCRGSKQIVMTLLQSGVDEIKSYINKCNSLCFLRYNKYVDFVDMITLAGSAGITLDVDACDLDNNTILMIMVRRGFAAMREIEFLIKHGCNVNYSRPDEVSILQMAAANCKSEDDAKVMELLLRYGANAQIVFSCGKTLVDFICSMKRVTKIHPLKSIIAHLAMLETIDKSALTKFTRNSMYANTVSKNHFDLCMQQLGKLKGTVINESLLKLLHEGDKKLVDYARNREFMRVLKKTMKHLSRKNSHYSNTLKKKIAEAINQAEVYYKAVSIIEALTGFRSDAHYIIVHKIFCFLDSSDLQILDHMNRRKQKIKYL